MENPICEEGVDEDESARFLMPAQRRTPGPSDSARFIMPAENPSHGVVIENGGEGNNETFDEIMDEDGDGANEQNSLKDVITVECHKLNGKVFNGTVNYSEAKIKIFQEIYDEININ